LKFLVAHNQYRQSGGEDAVFRNEVQLLRQAGHEVREYVETNHRIDERNQLRLGLQTVWNHSSRKKMRTVLLEFKPDVVHFHNILPLISPAAYSACAGLGIPVVQTLHNYRLLCPGSLLYRDGRSCEDCLTKQIKWPGVLHSCYRDSKMATAAIATMLAVHQTLGTWNQSVDRFVALSEFSRDKFVEGGLPAEKVMVKPNFVSPDPGPRSGGGECALFVGRLSLEKGLKLLIEAWKRVSQRIPLRIVGDGPLRGLLERDKESLPLSNVSLDGGLEKSAVLAAMKRARFMVFPSTCYENFPLVIAEAYACGVPVHRDTAPWPRLFATESRACCSSLAVLMTLLLKLSGHGVTKVTSIKWVGPPVPSSKPNILLKPTIKC
jgi:glycosyltransferase involved in cell wall biosynthesis